MVDDGGDVVGKAVIVICAGALELVLVLGPDTLLIVVCVCDGMGMVDSVRLGFWPGNVFLGSTTPSSEQPTTSSIVHIDERLSPRRNTLG